MKNTVVLILVSVSFLTSGYAQVKKELTLSDAILKQYGEFSPEKVNGLKWLNDQTYIRTEGEKGKETILSYDMKKKKESALLSFNDFKTLFASRTGVELKVFPSFDIISENLWIFHCEKVYYRFDPLKMKIESFENETGEVSNFEINHSGDMIAYVKESDVFIKPINESVIRVTNDGSEDIVYGKAVSRFEFGISKGLFWSPDDSKLAYYRNDQSAVTDYPLVNLKTTPAEVNMIRYPMAGGESEKISVRTYSLQHKTNSRMKTEDTDTYLCSVNWANDSRTMIIVALNRDQNHAWYKQFDGLNGEFGGILYEERDEKYVEPLYDLIFPDKNALKFIYLSQKDGFMHAYQRYNGEDKQLTKGEWVITRYIGMNEKKGLLYFEGTGDSPLDNEIYKVNLNEGTFSRISKNAGTYHVDLSPEASYMITNFTNLNTPSKVLIADGDGIVVKSILQASNPLDEYAVASPELLTIENSVGDKLHARMIKPHDFDPSVVYPVLVYVYNGPHVQLIRNRWWGGASLWMNYFAEKGYLVFTIDGRGSYNRGKEFEQSIFRNLSAKEMEDQLAGVTYLRSLPYVDREKIAVHGWSYGGFMTTSLMLKYPEVFKCGVAGGPVTNWKYYEVMYTERYMDDPISNPDGFKSTDLTNFTKQLKGKLLLIHGLEDDVVVPQHNFTLVQKFVEEGVQVDFFPYPGHPHNVRGKDRVHLMEKVLNYIDTNLQ